MKRAHGTIHDLESGNAPKLHEKPKGENSNYRKYLAILGLVFAILLVAVIMHQPQASSSNSSKNTADDWTKEIGPLPDFSESCSYEKMRDWVLSNGGRARKVEVREFPLESGKGMRRGMAALEDIGQDEAIVEVPLNLSMSWVSAINSDIGPIIKENPQLESFDVLALHIMYEARKKNSFWAPMLCLLPRQVPLPMFYGEEQMTTVKEEPLKKAIFNSRMFAKKRYNDVMPLMHNQYPSHFPRTENSLKDYAWAISLVLSRTWGVGKDLKPLVEKDGTLVHVMVPLADMFNHNNTAYSASFGTDSMKVIAHRDTKIGEELFLSYGQRCNTKFLTSYGFAPFGNENHSCNDE